MKMVGRWGGGHHLFQKECFSAFFSWRTLLCEVNNSVSKINCSVLILKAFSVTYWFNSVKRLPLTQKITKEWFSWAGGFPYWSVSIDVIPILGNFWYSSAPIPERGPPFQANLLPLGPCGWTRPRHSPGTASQGISIASLFRAASNCVSHCLFFPPTKTYDAAQHTPLI